GGESFGPRGDGGASRLRLPGPRGTSWIRSPAILHRAPRRLPPSRANPRGRRSGAPFRAHHEPHPAGNKRGGRALAHPRRRTPRARPLAGRNDRRIRRRTDADRTGRTASSFHILAARDEKSDAPASPAHATARVGPL